MFDIGFFELLLLFVIGLLVVGPERLPGLARQIGSLVARGRRLMNELRGQVERELHWQDLQKDLQTKTPPELQGLADEIHAMNQAHKANNPPRPKPSGQVKQDDN